MRGLLAFAVTAVLGCGGERPAPPTNEALGGAVARVGDIDIPAALVGQVARARATNPRAVLEALVQDVLAEHGARAHGFDRDPRATWSLATILARRLSEGLQHDARAQGPPRDEELTTLTVVRAVVLRAAALPEAQGLAIAQELQRAVAGARDADDFVERARAVPHAGARVAIGLVPPFDATGRTGDGAELDPGLVAAAFATRSADDGGLLVDTPLGWYVLRVVGRTKPDPSSLEAVRRDLAGGVVAIRAHARLDALIRARRLSTVIDVSAAADSLMAEAAAGTR